MFGFWTNSSPLFRFGLAGVCLLVSTLLWLAGIFWPWGWGAGVILLLLAGFRSDTEKKRCDW